MLVKLPWQMMLLLLLPQQEKQGRQQWQQVMLAKEAKTQALLSPVVQKQLHRWIPQRASEADRFCQLC
jgi:hypothetical protein